MKIIKEVEPPEQKGTEITCPNCGSELEYSKGDIVKSYIQDDPDTDSRDKPHYFIVCPVCKKGIDVKL